MLRTFHRFQKHLSGIVLILAIVLAMSGFGVNIFSPKQNNGAIAVDGEEISFSEFYRQVRNTEAQYRRIFGKKYDELAAQMGVNVPEQVKDRLIAEKLTEREARNLGLKVGEEERKEVFRDQIFPMGYTRERYKALLQEMNMSQDEFERSLDNNLLRLQFATFLRDAAKPSIAEARARYERAETKYGVRYLEFDPARFEKNAAPPSEEEIQRYYDEHQSDFETPAKVRYDYVIFSPDDFLQKVQVEPDEVDFLYTDNPTKYSTPEMVKVRQVRINLPEDKDPVKLEKAQKKAQDVLERAKAGTPIHLLAVQFSDDNVTKNNGGDLGWIKRGTMPEEFEAAAFAVEKEGVADLVRTEHALFVVKVEGHQQPQLKKKEEVQAEIEAEIRKRDAPAYASDKAQELYDTWTKTKRPLAEIAAAEGLKLVTGSGLLAKEQDPDPALRNLTSEVIESPDDAKELLVELANVSVLAEIKDRTDVALQPLNEVKGKIVAVLHSQAARNAALKSAEEALSELASGAVKLDEKAKKLGLTVGEQKDLNQAAGNQTGVFSNAELRKALFALSKVGDLPRKVIEAGKKFYVFQVSAVAPPATALDDAALAERIEQQQAANGDEMMGSILARARFDSKIDVNPAVLTH